MTKKEAISQKVAFLKEATGEQVTLRSYPGYKDMDRKCGTSEHICRKESR
jgi:hypothetical protein